MDLTNIFTHHPPVGDQAERYTQLRLAGRTFAAKGAELSPASAEQTLAIRAVQQAVMWFNAAIAINE